MIARLCDEAKEQQETQAKYIQGIFSSSGQEPVETNEIPNHLIEAKFKKSQPSQPSQPSQQNSEQKEELDNSNQLVLSDNSEDEDEDDSDEDVDDNDDQLSNPDKSAQLNSTAPVTKLIAPAAKVPLKACGIEKIDIARIEKLFEQGRFEEASELVIAVEKFANDNLLTNQQIEKKAAKESLSPRVNFEAKLNKKPSEQTSDFIGVAAETVTLTIKEDQSQTEPNSFSNAPVKSSDQLIKECEDLMKELNSKD